MQEKLPWLGEVLFYRKQGEACTSRCLEKAKGAVFGAFSLCERNGSKHEKHGEKAKKKIYISLK